MSHRILSLVLLTTSLGAAVVLAEEAKPKPLAGGRADLPQDHEYQRVLRKYMATLTEQDFAHGVTQFPAPQPGDLTPDEQYRNYIYTLTPQPLVGSKRGEPAINAPPALYTLAKIETPLGVFRPPGYSEATISLVQWSYPGNPYYDNRALKLRAFVGSAINLMMLDDHLDKNPLLVRTDRIPYYLVRCGAAYPAFKPLLPADAQKAFEDGLRKLAERVLALPPKGEEANLDMMAPVGLTYAAKALNDPAFTKRVEDYARKLFADPQYCHPAGYWVERGGLDISFSGTTNYFAIWAALANNWPFANEALDRVYRLRAHLMLPEPNGKFTGPTAFNTRTGGTAINDQWDYGNRDRGAAMITDEIAYLTPVPTPEQLATGGDVRASEFARQIGENPRAVAGQNVFQKNEQIVSGGWVYSILPSYNFPASVNPAFEFYRKGALARLQALAAKDSPLLKSPFVRGETFVRDFGGAFIVTRQPAYAAIVHAGPVATQAPDDGRFQFNAPLGFGGGQLAAFWTPATGSVLLTRRAGQHWDKPFDLVPAWRTWPLHAVSGQTAAGVCFTSAVLAKPETTVSVKGTAGTVKVGGIVPAAITGQKEQIAGRYDYARTFSLADAGVNVETTIAGDGLEPVAELYETLPVFLRDAKSLGPEDPKTTIEFQVGKDWTAATDAYAANVKAVRITRFTGAVVVSFDRPRRVKLSPADWKDAFLTGAICRNVLIDLLENGDQPAAVQAPRKVSYRIAAATP